MPTRHTFPDLAKCVVICITSLIWISGCTLQTQQNQWTMIDVTEGTKQADSHLIVFGKNHFDLIDTGFTGKKILPFLRAQHISRIKNIFISHPHKDHYGGTQSILEAGITIENLWINVPSKNFCDSEKPWGCDYEHVLAVIAFAKSKGVAIHEMKPGMTLDESQNLKLISLVAYQDTNSPTGREGGINDTSVLMRLSGSKKTVLFTGDLNVPLGTYLSQHLGTEVLHADYLKVPHHGTEGCAPDAFFDRVQAQAAFVPAPAELWESERSKRIKEYWIKAGVPIYVSGIHGNVTVPLLSDEPIVTTGISWYTEFVNKLQNLLERFR